ncbi:AsmA family protein [Verrucomicrobiaceae bacterium R5-34]|nr:AsmA family protein [Verrucomicrobiaceae bacterium R5-34]
MSSDSLYSHSSRRRGARRSQRKWLKLLAVVLALAIVLPVVAMVAVKTYINEEFVVNEIEAAINSEVEIGELDLALLSFPTRLKLSDVALRSKSERDSSGSVKMASLELEVNFWKLVKRHIEVSKITIDRAEITSTFFEDGSTSLEEMFRSPEDEPSAHDSEDGGVSASEGGFNAFEQQDFVTSLGGLEIKDSRVDITLEKTGLRIRCEDVHMELSSITVDPNNLHQTNTAQLKISSMVRLHSTKGWHYGDLDLSGEAKARIFNPETGDTEPNVEGRFDLADSSWLNTRVPVITKAWKTLSVLEKVGVKVAPLPERATFGRSNAVAAHYHLGKVTVREPLSIWVGDWELAALDGSWLQTETDQHEINAELVASVKSSERFLGLIGAVVKLVPQRLADALIEDVKDRLYRDDRLLVKIQSTGEFSDPKIRPVDGVPDLYENAKKAGEDMLKEKAAGLLRGLLGGYDD